VPSRRGNRKGAVEKVNQTAAQRWWRTLGDDVTIEEAQASLDRFATCAATLGRGPTAYRRSTVATVAATEPLATVPAAASPAIVPEKRTASRQALVGYRGNLYSVPPELAMATVTVTHSVGGQFIDIATTARGRHRPPHTARRRPRRESVRQESNSRRVGESFLRIYLGNCW
jgi:hypothetical protein